MKFFNPTENKLYADAIVELDEHSDKIDIKKLRSLINSSGLKIFVLDDDPTGTQTVHDVHVLTSWKSEDIKKALTYPEIITYVSTNTRSMDTEQAKQVQLEFLSSLADANQTRQREFRIVSRSDSTLRGHFLAETSALREGLLRFFGIKIDGTIVIPFFAEGNRFTIGDVHYIREGEVLIPVATTEFARDTLFRYQHSNLKLWIEEKTQNNVSAEKVHSIALRKIRKGGVAKIRDSLLNIHHNSYIIVNAINYKDLFVFVAGLIEAENAGKKFLYRTAASFVKIRGGQTQKGLLRKTDIFGDSPLCVPGLLVVGSYVQTTTNQLECLVRSNWGENLELSVEYFDDNVNPFKQIDFIISRAIQLLNNRKNVIISTSRVPFRVENKENQRQIENRVSNALVNILKRITKQIKPKFIVAKGGITSHVLARDALGVKSAMVLGQIAPGVPVWQLGEDSNVPNIPYIVFPGNVGDKHLLKNVVQELS
jgi:uncharacterized protein YgbK (DUF1537 family)